jgi:ZIP family zinc transporter
VLILVARAMEAAFEGASHRRAAFAMSLGAGMATGLGAALVLFTRSLDRRLLAGTMSFSAGVMLYVSLVEVVGVSNEHFAKSHAPARAYAYATASFFIGAAVMALVDRLVHVVFDMVAGNGHQHSDAATAHGSDGGGVELARARATDEHSRCLPRPGSDGAHGYDHDAALQHELDLEAFEDESGASIRALASVEEKSRLLMMAAVISAAIVLHNIPEGMATYVASYPPCMRVLTTAPSPHRYVASYHSVRAGAPLAIAIAIHNIPEGLAIAMPVFYATQSRWKAVGLGALSGMSEPLGPCCPPSCKCSPRRLLPTGMSEPFGAVLASFVANEKSSTDAFGFMFGLTGGMMSYVCLAELLPAAFLEKGVSKDLVTAAFFGGCLMMASSLVIEKFATEGSAE